MDKLKIFSIYFFIQTFEIERNCVLSCKMLIRRARVCDQIFQSRKMSERLCVKRLSENAIMPVRGSKYSAGYDLSSAEEKVVPAHGKALVKTDIAISIPENTYARIAPRLY
jgi:hypothetical protein